VHADAAVPDGEVTQASASQKRKAGAIQGVTPVKPAGSGDRAPGAGGGAFAFSN
jgi:hypothetical protein